MNETRHSTKSYSPRWAAALWGTGGLALLAYSAAFLALAPEFTYGSVMAARPIPALVLLLVLAGAIYMALVGCIPRTAPSRALVVWIFAAGALMRLVVSLSQPMLEDDWHRYLWDGAMTAAGINPYSQTPAAAQAGVPAVGEGTQRLAAEAGTVLGRVNHPELGTIYPPVAQAAFALAHRLTPWRLSGLRTLYFAVDCAVFALLAALLRQCNRSPLAISIYWWNPLLLKECYNSVHMDILLVPWLLAALLLLLQRRVVFAALALAVAVAVKLWPVLLLPPLLAAAARTPRKLVAAVLLFGVAAAALLAPMAATRVLGNDAGLAAYSQRWEMNDALFMAFPWLAAQLGDLAGVPLTPQQAHRTGRALAAVIAGLVALAAGLAILQKQSAPGDSRETPRQMAAWWCGIVAVLFLVSPTQFPWYFVWMLPFLALVPRTSLLLLTVLLPLYYLKFYFDARGQVDFFHYRVVWLEYAPVWALLLWEWRRHRRTTAPPGNIPA